MPAAVTAFAQSQHKSRVAIAVHRLLDGLRPFIRAYAATEDEQKSLPPLDMGFVIGVDGGPEIAVQSAIRSHPALWADAIPEDCCIVPRDVLRNLIGEYAAESLEMTGAAVVENRAAHFRRLAE